MAKGNRKRQRKNVDVQIYDGMPWTEPLHKWEGDGALSSHFRLVCCNCGLRHLVTLQLVKNKVTLRFYQI